MTTVKELQDLIQRFGLEDPITTCDDKLATPDPDDQVSFWKVDGEALADLVYRMNQILDRLVCVDAQATRWRTQRDEALAKVEALEKQNGDLAASYLEALFGAKVQINVEVPVTLPVVCQHPRTIGTTGGWKCVDCGVTVRQYSDPVWIDPHWNF